MNTAGTVIAFVRRAGSNAFTPRDLAELTRWAGEERRFALHEDGSDMFALLYSGAAPWASWGVAREGDAVLLWNCVSLADVGCFRSMVEALAVLPGLPSPAPLPNVVCLDEIRRRAG